jgi:hypothetical protein
VSGYIVLAASRANLQPRERCWMSSTCDQGAAGTYTRASYGNVVVETLVRKREDFRSFADRHQRADQYNRNREHPVAKLHNPTCNRESEWELWYGRWWRKS